MEGGEYTPELLRRAGDDPDALLELLATIGYAVADVYEDEGDIRERARPLTEPLDIDGYVNLVVRASPA